MKAKSIVLVALCVLAGMSSGAFAKQAVVQVELSQSVLPANQPNKLYVRVSLTGPEKPNDAQRPPVNVSIVLDKSGSMQGDKIREAKRAAIEAVRRLKPNDILSVIAYDSHARVLVPATKVYDGESIVRAIQNLSADGSTALFAGVSLGANELRKFGEPDQVNRVILLSDGLANIGPSAPGELGDLGRSLGREGIAVTTIGLGLGYNEDLLTQLAQNSDGNHIFAENASDVSSVFAAEFSDVLSVTAQQLEISLDCAQGVRIIRMLGRQGVVTDKRAYLRLNQLYAGQSKYVLLELEVPPTESGHHVAFGTARVSFDDSVSGKRQTVEHALITEFSDDKDLTKHINSDVMASAVHQIGVEQNELATALRDRGEIDKAREVLGSNIIFLERNADRYNNETLRQYSIDNDSDLGNLDDVNWNRQRKVMKQKQHSIKTQQKVKGAP